MLSAARNYLAQDDPEIISKHAFFFQGCKSSGCIVHIIFCGKYISCKKSVDFNVSKISYCIFQVSICPEITSRLHRVFRLVKFCKGRGILFQCIHSFFCPADSVDMTFRSFSDEIKNKKSVICIDRKASMVSENFCRGYHCVACLKQCFSAVEFRPCFPCIFCLAEGIIF